MERARKPGRLLLDHPAGGAWQMAVDEVLLETAAGGGPETLRFYAWVEPTLSLGYFQPASQRSEHPDSRSCPLVRRQTGGGAIVHDRELTYSLAVRQPGRTDRDARRLYAAVHEALIDVLAALGVEARVSDETAGRAGEGPFLCFQRRSAGDVLLGEAKICGSAQRRRQAAILQHGSLLLGRSEFAPQLSGLAELTGRAWKPDEVKSSWRIALAERLGYEWGEQRLTAAELDRTRTLAVEKYDSATWNSRR